MADAANITFVEEYCGTNTRHDRGDAECYRSLGCDDLLPLMFALLRELGTIQSVWRECLVDRNATD